MAQTLTDTINQRIESLTSRLNACNVRIEEIKQLELSEQVVRELSGILHTRRKISEELEDWTSLK